jgi:hypothetical protein
LRVRLLATEVQLLSGRVDVSVRSAFEVGPFTEDKVEEVVVEFVVHIDKDWTWCQKGGIRGAGRTSKERM